MAGQTQAAAFASATYDWLVAMDPLAFDGSESQLDRAARGLNELVALTRQIPAGASDVATSAGVLGDQLPQVAPSDRVGWLDLRERLAPYYDDLARSLRAAGGSAKDLHPTNYKRSLVHLVLGLAVVFCFQFVFTEFSAKLTAAAFVVWAWSLEAARRLSPWVNAWCMWFFGPIARDHEHYKINSATWYGTALFVLAFTAFGPGGVIGLLALAVGDPMAGIVGRRWGRIRMGGKSLEGSLAFALAAAGAAALYLLLNGSRDPVELVAVPLLGGVVGAVVELLSTRLEDNITIPVFTAWTLQFAWFGFP